MLTKIVVKNFKKLESAEIELGSAVVFVGPNNSGKTSALQAIALWDLGMRVWNEKRKKTKAKTRTAAVINRKDILAAPIPDARMFWNNLQVRESKARQEGKGTKNVFIEISAEGCTQGKTWNCGFEFDYHNAESIYCDIIGGPSNFPQEALQERIGFLPPMSGLSTIEDKLETGSIQSRIGEGRTAEVLRNLCLIVFNEENGKWSGLINLMQRFFSIELEDPNFDQTTGKITMHYKENGKRLDLSNSGRGFQQILLLLSYIYSGQNTILLLDEPDAHLEIIRQKEIFNLLSEIVRSESSQLILATHSEAILDEASEKDKIVAFLGRPHVVNEKKQLVKSLTTIGFDQYLQAEQKGRVVYLEGSTDLSLLKAFAEVLEHPIKSHLNNAFVKYTSNNPRDARSHFHGLKEAVSNLKGIAVFDRIQGPLQDVHGLKEFMWKRYEIENYLPIPEVLERYAQQIPETLFDIHDLDLLKENIEDYIPPVAYRDKSDNWWIDTKMSDFLEKVFRKYFTTLGKPILLDKGSYYQLALLAKPKELDSEIIEKLDAIWDVLKTSL